MTNNTNIGAQGVSWTVFGAECLTAVYDLRWMIILAVILIGTDFWWGCRELASKRKKATRAMDNVEDIQEYDITEGYPEKLDLSVDFLKSM